MEFGQEELCTLAAVLGALAPLTGLVDLDFLLPQPVVVPAALGLFKHLQSLALRRLPLVSWRRDALTCPIC